MYLNFADPKIKNFCDFILNPIAKNENSEITEIDQKLKILKYWNGISKMFLKYCSNNIILKMIQPHY